MIMINLSEGYKNDDELLYVIDIIDILYDPFLIYETNKIEILEILLKRIHHGRK